MQPSYLFLGVCGMGMGPLALYLKGEGNVVYGQDDAPNPLMQSHLDAAGVEHWQSVDALPPAVSAVVFSPAISVNHPLRQLAAKSNVPQVCRGLFLAQCLEGKRLIAIAGSHGKTTTTALLIHALKKAGIPFSYLLGGVFRDTRFSPAHYEPSANWVVAELDESDGTITAFSPEITICLNLDWDHPGYYSSEAVLDATFSKLIAKTRKTVLLPFANQRLLSLKGEANVYTFGSSRSANFSAMPELSAEGFLLHLNGSFNHQAVALPLQGAYNAGNAVAALAAVQLVAGHLPASPFADYQGVARRQDLLFKSKTVQIIADYAHHPAELEALIEGFSTGDRQLIVVFQPHRYTRTAQYAKDFASVLQKADALYLLPVYPASEAVLENGQVEAIAAYLNDHPTCVLPGEGQSFFEALRHQLSEQNTLLLFIGAGDIEKIAAAFTKDYAWAVNLEHKLSKDTIFRLNEPLASKTTLRVGGAARFYAEPANVDDLKVLIQSAKENAIPWFVLGRGSNLLVLDEGFDGLVIRLNNPTFQSMLKEGDLGIWAGTGVRLKELCGQAASWGIAGFEFLEGIPGSLGGALRMNAGAMGGWTFDRVEQVEVLWPDGSIECLPRASIPTQYRSCPLLKEAIALRALLKGTTVSTKEAVNAQMADFATHRKTSQPRESSAGCMFKNPDNHSAGKLVDEAGLKGTSVGAAEVSLVHGNFFINKGGATSSDVISLVKNIRQQVYEKDGLWLEPEVIILGKETWSALLQSEKAR